jgi:hypothetical protein
VVVNGVVLGLLANPEVIVGLDSPTRRLVPQSVQYKIAPLRGGTSDI